VENFSGMLGESFCFVSLDRAFRLITLYRMAGPILQSDTRVPWASRTNSPTFARGRKKQPGSIWSISRLSTAPDHPHSSEHRFADSSPAPYPTPNSGPVIARTTNPRLQYLKLSPPYLRVVVKVSLVSTGYIFLVSPTMKTAIDP